MIRCKVYKRQTTGDRQTADEGSTTDNGATKKTMTVLSWEMKTARDPKQKLAGKIKKVEVGGRTVHSKKKCKKKYPIHDPLCCVCVVSQTMQVAVKRRQHQ